MELELIARKWARSPEASFAIPMVVQDSMPCPVCQADELRSLDAIFKDRKTVSAADNSTIGFMMAALPEGETVATVVARTRIALPAPCGLDDPTTVILGVPMEVQIQDAFVEASRETAVAPPSDAHSAATSVPLARNRKDVVEE